MNAYIVLTNSDSSLSKRFRVVGDGYRPVAEKLGQRRVTVTGRLDNQVGPIVHSWRHILKVYAEDPDGSEYGTLDDLKTFFSYKPGETPSDVITFTEHDGTTTHEVYLLGSLSERNLTTYLDGPHACFLVEVEMVETEPS